MNESVNIYARTWKQPERLSIEEWIKKVWYIYTMQYYSATEKNEIISFAGMWMNLKIVIPSEVKERQIMYDIAYMWNLK